MNLLVNFLRGCQRVVCHWCSDGRDAGESVGDHIVQARKVADVLCELRDELQMIKLPR
jgi:hypothetical protein